ncbi:MAG TPA: glycerol-3-phosphate dehydrogenase [Candidatus Nanopelagicaceae bacterium]
MVETSILTSALSPAYRQRVISELSKEEFDLLVIGGGVNGAGIALDAASRGLSVALVEANDFASGTSSRSSKLIHGGLRYLEQYDFKLVREALQERELMITTIAPHLVRPVSFLYPLQEKLKERTYVGAGMALYDALRGFKRALPWHKHVSQKELSEIAPSLRLDLITGGYRYFDAQVDDARHTMMIARTAAKYGALVGTRIKCESLLKEGKRIVGAKVRDLITDKEIVVKARVTVMATGVWTDEMYKSFGIKPGYKVRTSKGAHIVVPGDAIKSQSGVIIKTDNSVLFIIPWAGKWIVGTTDTDYKDELAEPVATRADIDYIIHQANRVLEPKLDKSQVIGAFAGLRPLISQEDNAETADLSREHVVDHPVPGFVTIAGGKYTTYRVMSEDAVNEAVSDLNRIIPDSCTDSLSVIGADGYAVLKNQVKRLANTYQIDVNTVTHLLERYGSLIAEVLDSSPLEYLEKLSPDLPYLKAEIWYAVTHEGALSISDVMYRRTRLNFELKDQGISLLDEIAEIVATALGWDLDKKEESMKQYRDLVARQEMARFN